MMIDKVFGRLTVISFAGVNLYKHKLWICQCACGGVRQVTTSALPRTKSCGCLRHGLSGTRMYKNYQNMKERCTNPNNPGWKHYGGRGIEFRLGSYQEFMKAMRPTWRKGLSIDRIDNAGHYEIGNLRWATSVEQNRNKRSNVWLTYNGETMLQTDWAKRLGVVSSHVRSKLRALKNG